MNADRIPPRTPPSRTYPKGDRRRSEIVRAALAVFASGGYRGASMVKIAEACGVSRAGLLHHFPTKESLLAAVLEERDRIDGERFFHGVDPARDGIDYFRRLIALVEHNTTQRDIVSLFATLSAEAGDPEHPAHAHFAERYRRIRGHIAAALRDADARGLVRPGIVVDGLESDLIALLDGMQTQWLIDPAGVDPPARFRAVLSTILTEPVTPAPVVPGR